jgi:hypothetical protein
MGGESSSFVSYQRMAMLSLPTTFISVMVVFPLVFSKSVWQRVKVLITGALLAPGLWTVTVVVSEMGLSTEIQVQSYHGVLNRALWSSLTASRPLRLLMAMFGPWGASSVVSVPPVSADAAITSAREGGVVLHSQA